MKKSVFISYSHQDNKFAQELEDALRKESIDVWIDKKEILVGDSLIEKIRGGIEHSQFICAIISNNSINSKWVKKELDVAMNIEIEEKEVKVLPLIIEENVKLPSFLLGKMYIDFSRPQYFQGGISQILRRLNK